MNYKQEINTLLAETVAMQAVLECRRAQQAKLRESAKKDEAAN
jgi:hypothetical protein